MSHDAVLNRSSKDQRLEVGHSIHHPAHGEGVLKGSWGDVINIYFAEHDKVITVHDNDNLFLVRNSSNSWSLLTEADAVRIAESTKAERAEEYDKLQAIFQNDFLNHNELFQKLNAKYISSEDHDQLALDFVRNWMQEICILHNKDLPDDEQLLAISSVTGNYQVIARAGSGKTTTLVYRTLFLLKHCKVDDRDIVLLAFNKSAALQVRERLLALLNTNAAAEYKNELNRMLHCQPKGNKSNIIDIHSKAVDFVAEKLQIALPFVMTFHALAYAVVRPEQSILLDGEDDDAQGLSEAIQTVIDEHIRHPDYHDQIRDLMLAHFRGNWELIESRRYDLGMQGLLSYRRSLVHESIGGRSVKSFGEKLIANFLFEHDIQHDYGWNASWKGAKFTTGFSVKLSSTARLIIEYSGEPDNLDENRMIEQKRAYWNSKIDCKLIEMAAHQLESTQIDAFLNELKQHLVEYGVECHRLSEDEIWEKIRKRAIDKFTSVTKNFVGRCRKKIISPTDLSDLIKNNPGIAWLFHDIVLTIYRAYLDRLSATGEEDFDGLMLKAAELISNGKSIFKRRTGSGDLASIRFLAIDEYQDFSALFNRVIKAIQNINPNVGFFCVGDDWQAINGFAGSDLKYFMNFERYIENPNQISITTNYRSCASIVAASNAVMADRGIPAKAHKKSIGSVFVADSSSFVASPFEFERHQYDAYTPMVLRLIHKSLTANADVVLLSRTNTLPKSIASDSSDEGNKNELSVYLQKIWAYFPDELHQKITISTAHKYKGLEKSTVIILDAFSNRYPLIHPDWVFPEILGESIEKIVDEERRLFYVALSRAVDTLIVITDSKDISPFLTSLESKLPIKPVDWNDHPPLPDSLESKALYVRLSGNTFDVKEFLKSNSYKYEPAGKAWSKVYLLEGFNVDMIKSENWVSLSKSIDVQVSMANDKLLAHYVIHNGEWSCIFDGIRPEPMIST